MMLFVNMQGFRIHVVQVVDAMSAAAPPPPPRKPANDEEEDAADSDGDRWDGCWSRHASKEPQNQAPKNLGKAVGTSRKSVQLRHVLPCADEVEVLTSLPKMVVSQYDSNLTKDGDIFPLVAQFVASASLPIAHTEEDSANESEKPPISLPISKHAVHARG
jgi:hypothetical protein